MGQLAFTFSSKLALLSPDELYHQAESLLEHLREDRRFERKSARTSPRSLGEYLSMWANTLPDGGIIAVGVEDNGAVSGCTCLSQTELNEREQAGKVYCPGARYDTKRISAINRDGSHDFILLFRVQYRQDRVVYDSGETAWIRIGDQKHKLSTEECRELEIDKGQLDFEREPVLDVPYPEAFDKDKIALFAENFRKSRNLSYDQSNEQILALRHLGKIENESFIPNIACILVFATDPMGKFPGCRLRFRRFEGEQEQTGSRDNSVKDEWVEGSLPKIVDHTAALIDSQVRNFSRLANDGRFYVAPEYPRDAWFEAIVNACVHRSYGMKNMHIRVDMFYDRLVVESPGGFPPFVTPDNIYITQHARNPKLMDAMLYLGFVKFANEGAKRMRDEMKAMSLPAPLFEQKSVPSGNSVRVTLRNDYRKRRPWIDSDVSSVLGDAVAKSLTPEESRAINFIAQHGQINVSQLHDLVSSTVRTWHTCRKILLGLTKRGILEYRHRTDIAKDPKGHFILAEMFRKRKA